MTKSSFEKLIDSPTPLLIDFYADWCGPCKIFSPILKEIKEEIGDDARIIKIDVDKNQALSQKLNIMSIPTTHLYLNGELIWQVSGVQTKTVILKKIRELL
jgi:thioredoxin 1